MVQIFVKGEYTMTTRRNPRHLLRTIVVFVLILTMVLSSIPMVFAAGALQDQINSAGSGATIKLEADSTEALTIPSGKQITLDLNGHNLTPNTATAITNNGNLTIRDSVGGGTVSCSSSNSMAYAILNNSGATLKVTGGIFKAHTNGGNYASALQNYGRITEISGGDFIGTNNGEQYGYGLRNETGGVVELISDGWFYGDHTAPSTTSLNCVGVNNADGEIRNITGGIFIGNVRSNGYGAGFRSGKGQTTISGGAFFGRVGGQNTYDSSASIYTNGYVTPTYPTGYSLSANPHSASVVKSSAQSYVVLTDEMEKPVAAYVFENNNIVKKWGHTSSSYSIYLDGTTKTITEANLANYRNQTLYVNTGDKRQVLMFVGSSVTYGTGSYGNTFADFLEDDYGYISNKRAISGTTLVTSNGGNYVQRMRDQISPNAKIDKFIVQLSTNDSGQGKPLGTMGTGTSLNDFDTTTIIGAMEYMIVYAKQTWDADVLFWTCQQHEDSRYDAMYYALLDLQKKYPDLGIIDFYSQPQLDSSLVENPVHPKLEGYRVWTPYAAQCLAEYDEIHGYGDRLAAENNGKSLYIDFEDGTAKDLNNNITPIVGNNVKFVNDGKFGKKSASFENVTNSYDYLISWKMDEYDPWLHASNGSAVSMWVKLNNNIQNNAVIFNYGFFGFRFFLRYVDNGLTVSARYEDGVGTSEFNVPGLGAYKGQWVNITVTCDASNLYTVYFNGQRAGQQTLTYSMNNIASYAANTTKRNQSEAYTGYYSIGGAAYWAAGVSGVTSPYMSGSVDDLALFNRSLSEFEVLAMVDTDTCRLDNASEVTVISGPGNTGDEGYNKMFDSLTGTKFGNATPSAAPFIWKTDEPVTARYYGITTGYDSMQWTGRNPKTWTLYGCAEDEYNNGNANWHVLDAKSNNTSMLDLNSREYLFTIPEANVDEYQYFRLDISDIGGFMQIDEFTLCVDATAQDKYEAEDATLIGGASIYNRDVSDLSGNAGVQNLGANAGSLQFTVNIESAGQRNIDIYYATYVNRSMDISVNGGDSVNIMAEGNNSDWFVGVNKASVLVDLNEGENTITITNNTDYAPQIDCIVVIDAKDTNLYGDVDMNGTVNVNDLLKLKELILAKQWTEEELLLGDMNKNDKLDVADILLIKNIIKGA